MNKKARAVCCLFVPDSNISVFSLCQPDKLILSQHDQYRRNIEILYMEYKTNTLVCRFELQFIIVKLCDRSTKLLTLLKLQFIEVYSNAFQPEGPSHGQQQTQLKLKFGYIYRSSSCLCTDFRPSNFGGPNFIPFPAFPLVLHALGIQVCSS